MWGWNAGVLVGILVTNYLGTWLSDLAGNSAIQPVGDAYGGALFLLGPDPVKYDQVFWTLSVGIIVGALVLILTG